MKHLIIIFLSILILSLLINPCIYAQDNPDTYKEYAESSGIPTRSENQNAVLLDVGTEPLIIGVEFMRFLRIENGFLPYMSLGGGVGSWLEGPSFWGTARFYVGESNWAPYIGTSIVIWNGELPKKNSSSITEAKINALGVYIPIGIQYHGKNGLIFSWEFSVHTIVTANWTVKEIEKQPDTKFSFGKQGAIKGQFWGGFKVGFSF